MGAKETVLALLNCIQNGDFATARTFLSDDFRYGGAALEPVSADVWLAMSKELKTAFPNLDYHFHLETLYATTACISTQLRGTQTGTLDLTGINMGKHRGSQKSFVSAREEGKLTVEAGQVTSWVVQPVKGAGMQAILGQLGIKPPTK